MPTPISSSIIEKIRKEAKAHFRGARSSHGWDHTERVLALALHIGRKEGEGRRLARARHAFMVGFFRQLTQETRGIR